MLLCHSACVLLVHDKYKKENLLVLALFAIYPYMHVGSAGWICTSLNYMWPMATLLYALSGAARHERGEELSQGRYLLYGLAMVFTANCEMSATVLVFAGAYMLLRYYATKKVSEEADLPRIGYGAAVLLIGLVGLTFAMTAPGNGERTAMEAINWMPEFPDLNMSQKFRLCAVFVFEHFVMIPDVPFFLFSLLLCFTGWQKDAENGQSRTTAGQTIRRIIALIPLAIDVAFTAYYFV